MLPSPAPVRCWMRTCECPPFRALLLLVLLLLLLRMPWYLLQLTGGQGSSAARGGGGGGERKDRQLMFISLRACVPTRQHHETRCMRLPGTGGGTQA